MCRVDLDPAIRRTALHECRAAYVPDCPDGLTGCQAVSDLADLALGVPVDQEIRLGIEQYRAPHLLRPVIEVCDAPQRGFDPADHDRHVLEGLAQPLRVHDDRAIRPPAAFTSRGVRIVAANT